MEFTLCPERLDDIVAAFQRDGVVVLDGVDDAPREILTAMLCEKSGLTPDAVDEAGVRGHVDLTPELRSKLARGEMTDELANACVDTLGDLLLRLIGPVIHVSRTFHFQVKSRSQSDVIRHGYSGDGREVSSLYGVHDEFTAARVLTSPSAVVCWVPLNTYDGDALYFYPGSHRLGLMTNRWLPRHASLAGADQIGAPIAYRPRKGQLVLFHFLLLHGSGSPAPGDGGEGDPTRMSCDLRFFPLCGVLDSPARTLVDDPVSWIQKRLEELDDELLQAPLCEALAYLRQPLPTGEPSPLSALNWASFVAGLIDDDADLRRRAVEGLVNQEIGFDPIDVFHERFASAALSPTPYSALAPDVPAARDVLRSRWPIGGD